MKLIDKDAVLAIIEKELSYYKDLEDRKTISDCGIAGYRVVKMLKSDIESLEVKEVDLDSDIRTYLTNHFNIYEDGILQSKKSGLPLSTYDIIKVAKHFFELGIQVSNKAQKGE